MLKRNSFIAILMALCLSTFLTPSCKREVQTDSPFKQPVGPVFHKLSINGNKVIIKEANGAYFFSDDEILSPNQFNLLKQLSSANTSTKQRSVITTEFVKKWPGGIVYYNLDLTNKDFMIQNAMNYIAANTALTFVARTTQSNYIEFLDVLPTDDEQSSRSPVGMQSGKQNLWLNNFATQGTAIHEILHAIGIFHEQSHPSRNNYIEILLNNIPDDVEHNFNIEPNSQGIGPFDFGSIMLYPSRITVNGQSILAMTRLDNTEFQAQRDTLSTGDINGIADLYGPFLNGFTPFCNPTSFTITPVPLNSNITWSVVWNQNATLNTTTGPTVTVTRTGDIYSDLVLTAQITYASGRVQQINKLLLSNCQIPIQVRAFRNGQPRPLAGGLKFIDASHLNGTEYIFDWHPFNSYYIVPGDYFVYCYLNNGTNATINLNGVTQTVTGMGLNSVGIGDGIDLGIITVSNGFFAHATF